MKNPCLVNYFVIYLTFFIYLISYIYVIFSYLIIYYLIVWLLFANTLFHNFIIMMTMTGLLNAQKIQPLRQDATRIKLIHLLLTEFLLHTR